MRHLSILLLFSVMLFGALPKFLMPDEAFKPSAVLNDKQQVEVTVNIAEDIYLYEEKLHVRDVNGDDDIIFESVIMPKSVEFHDEMVFLDSPTIIINLAKKGSLSGKTEIQVAVEYQGCSEQGLCYEPLEKVFTLEVNRDTLAIDSTKNEVIADIKKEEPKVNVEVSSESDTIAQTLKEGSLGLIILSFLGFGLLLALTPCVFPMIPILSSVIVAQGENITTRKAFMMSLVYVLAMSVAYTVAGVLAVMFGANLQAAFQTPWIIVTFSLIFVALSLSMFDYYELQMPQFIQSRLNNVGQKQGGYYGVALMGFFSALIVGPCVAAPLAGALIYIGQTGDALLGGIALFALSMGMGIPLIIVGVSAGKFMPKPGDWMTMVSAVFGVVMLAVAIWMLEKVVAPSVTMILYSVLGIGFALFLGVFEKGGHFFKHSIAMIIFIYSVSLFVGFLAGSSSMTKPLGFLNKPASVGISGVAETNVEFQVVKSISELDTILQANKGKKIMLDFSADWCTSCKEFEEVTFVDKAVRKKMNEFVLIRADVTDNSDKEKALSKKFGVFGPPAILFFDKDLKVRESKTIIGFTEPAEFLEHLNKI